jgi:PKD repeat protein
MVTHANDTSPAVNAGSPITANAGSSVTFSQAAVSGGTAPLTYLWSFGDGTQQSGSLNPSHTYQNPGNYTATVTATDANKLSSSSSVTVTVNDMTPTDAGTLSVDVDIRLVGKRLVITRAQVAKVIAAIATLTTLGWALM